MQAKNEISEELRSLSTVVDAISRTMPYGLPVDFFGNFPDEVKKRIDRANAGIAGTTGILIPGVPADHVLDTPFEVPQGYFEGLAGGIIARIKAGALKTSQQDVAEELALLSPLLSKLDRQTPYRLPEGYFEQTAPILACLRDKNPFEVPVGYFDGLAADISTKIDRPVPGRVISMGGRRSWWKYSAAAVVVGLALSIGWLRWHTPASGGFNIQPSVVNVAALSDQDLQNYLDSDNLPLAESVTNSTATLDIDDNDVKSLLGDVPDGDLKEYMENHGAAKDNATN